MVVHVLTALMCSVHIAKLLNIFVCRLFYRIQKMTIPLLDLPKIHLRVENPIERILEKTM